MPRYEKYNILGYGLKEGTDVISPFIFMRYGTEAVVRVFD